MDTDQEYYLLVYQLSEDADIARSQFEKEEISGKLNHERIRDVLSDKAIFPNAFQVMNTTWIIQYSSQEDIFSKIKNFFMDERSKLIIELVAKDIKFVKIDNEDKMKKCMKFFGRISFKNYFNHCRNNYV